MTYAGLVEGVPTAVFNDRMLQELVDDLATRFRRPVRVIDPRRDDLEAGGSAGHRLLRRQLLPRVRCIGVFDSDRLNNDGDPEFAVSTLVIAWFQQDPQFPVSPDALPELQAVDWDTMAVDWD